MEFFKKRRNAILIAVVVIVLATVFGVHRSLSSAIRKVEDGFADGVFSETLGYQLPSIESQLRVQSNAGTNMLTIGAKYGAVSAETQALREARLSLQELLEGDAGPSLLYDADQRFVEAAEALYRALSALDDLTAADRADLETDYGNITGAARVIANSEYNDSVRAFQRDVLGVFPTNLLRHIAFVDGPELFA